MVGFPAARLTDLHVCPMFTVLVPHVGGPIAGPGAPTHPPRTLMLYGSLRTRSYSRFASEEAARRWLAAR